jgi:hypothetical protein
MAQAAREIEEEENISLLNNIQINLELVENAIF